MTEIKKKICKTCDSFKQNKTGLKYLGKCKKGRVSGLQGQQVFITDSCLQWTPKQDNETIT